MAKILKFEIGDRVTHTEILDIHGVVVSVYCAPQLVERATDLSLTLDGGSHDTHEEAMGYWTGKFANDEFYDNGLPVMNWWHETRIVHGKESLDPERLFPFAIPSGNKNRLRIIGEGHPYFLPEKMFSERATKFMLRAGLIE